MEEIKGGGSMPTLGVWMWPESVEKRGARETVGRCVTILPSTYTLSDTEAYSDMLAELDIDDFKAFVRDKYGDEIYT